jgi:cell wall-associated NlpC family hydrolase
MKKSIFAVSLVSLMFLNTGGQLNETANKPNEAPTQFNLTKELVEQSKQKAAQRILAKQKQMLHKVIKYIETRVQITPYVFSGSSVRGWDCSGLVRYAYGRLNIELPHSADKQGHLGTRVSKPQLGDIVAFAYPNSTRFYHSGIYLYDGLVLNANAYFKTTIIEPLTNYKGKQIRFIRILDGN